LVPNIFALEEDFIKDDISWFWVKMIDGFDMTKKVKNFDKIW